MTTTFKRTSDIARGELLNAVAIADVTITLKSGHGDEFPSFAGNSYWVTIFGDTLDDGYEVCLCTGRTGDVLTVTRAQLGTAAQAWNVDDSVQMIIQAQHFDDITTAINNIENGTTELASLNCDINGLDVNPGSDTDADLITVGVTGAPKLWWDESEDRFDLTKGLNISSGSLSGTFSDIDCNSLTVGNSSNTKVLFIPYTSFVFNASTTIYDFTDGNGFLNDTSVAMEAFASIPLPGVSSIIQSVVAHWESGVAASTGSIGLFKFAKAGGARTQVAALTQAFSAMSAETGGYYQTLSSGGPWTIDTDYFWMVWMQTNNTDGKFRGVEITYRDREY